MLLAALATVVIASCYDGDTCTTTKGERVRLACIDTPELVGKRAEPAPAKAARDHLRNLVVGKKVGIRRITEDRYGRTVAELFLGAQRQASAMNLQATTVSGVQRANAMARSIPIIGLWSLNQPSAFWSESTSLIWGVFGEIFLSRIPQLGLGRYASYYRSV